MAVAICLGIRDITRSLFGVAICLGIRDITRSLFGVAVDGYPLVEIIPGWGYVS